MVSFVKKLNADYRRRWKELTGTILAESAWGMTETHTSNTFTTGFQDDDFDLNSQPIFVGLPVPGAEFKITDFETGALMPIGGEGEIRVRTPSLLKSYWNKPEATAEALVDGWLRTGDIGLIDTDGFIHFLGRRKEMLKVKGMSVFPPEIEALLGQHPAVLGSGVVGREDAERGQVPVAYIQLKPEAKGTITPAGVAGVVQGAHGRLQGPRGAHHRGSADDGDRQGEEAGTRRLRPSPLRRRRGSFILYRKV